MKLFFEKIKKTCREHRFIMAAIFAVVVVLGASVDHATAYFTTYATAKGDEDVELGDSTTVQEEFKDWKKIIRVQNIGDVECFVRVKIFAGKEYKISPSGNNWSQGSDGYWYYAKPLPAGATTEDPLVASITVPKNLNISFDVVVVQECTPVIYDQDNNPVKPSDADWSRASQYIKGEGKKS